MRGENEKDGDERKEVKGKRAEGRDAIRGNI